MPQGQKRFVHGLIFPILMYGSESWTMRQSEIKKIDATEMYCWRRMLRIPWTARRTNESIIQELNITERLSTSIQSRILKYFGHVMRRDADCMEKLIIQSKVPGRRPRGRSPSWWIDQLLKITHKPLHTLVQWFVHAFFRFLVVWNRQTFSRNTLYIKLVNLTSS